VVDAMRLSFVLSTLTHNTMRVAAGGELSNRKK